MDDAHEYYVDISKEPLFTRYQFNYLPLFYFINLQHAQLQNSLSILALNEYIYSRLRICD